MDKNIAALIREDTRTVGVRFYSDGWGQQQKQTNEFGMSAKEYTYVTDLNLVIGDMVVVLVSSVPKVCLVTRVDEECLIPPNHDMEFKWIVSKVDTKAYEQSMLKNQEIESLIAKSYKANVRNSFRTTIMAGLSKTDQAKLKKVL